jgi:putative molybdopterin biosynthesis protein
MPSPLTLSQIKTLSDPRRLAVLRRLMAVPATLTHLGEALGEHPAWVRHHLEALLRAGLVVLDHTETGGGRTEKYYRASAPALVLQTVILPEAADGPFALLMGSHDLALESSLLDWAAEVPGLHVASLPVGSLDGLAALRQGLCHLAGCHLLDVETDEYNLPYVRRFFPDREMLVLTLAERQQGLLVAPGNPLRLKKLEDLGSRPLQFANRQRGSGTRLWLDRNLAQLGIPAAAIIGYEVEFTTHTAVADQVRRRLADCGVGLLAAARQAGLGFIPLFHERFDLVLARASAGLPAIQALLERIHSAGFRRSADALGGYSLDHSGEVRLSGF